LHDLTLITNCSLSGFRKFLSYEVNISPVKEVHQSFVTKHYYFHEKKGQIECRPYRNVFTDPLGTGRGRSTLGKPLVKLNEGLWSTIKVTQVTSRRWRLCVSRPVMI